MRGKRRYAGCLLAIGMAALFGRIPGAQAQDSDRIAATVNGATISEHEFYTRLQRVRAGDFIVSVNPLTVKSDTAGQLVLNSLITERLIIQWASRTGNMPTDAEVNTELDNLKKQSNVVQALANRQITEDALKYDIRWQRARFNLATTSLTVTPDEVEKYYKAHVANFTTPERWTLSAIRTMKMENVAKIQADMKANKPFEEMVKAYNDDANLSARNGELGVLNANDPSVPAPLKEAVKALTVGQTTPPVKLELDAGPGKPKIPAWWFLRLNKKDPEVTRAFAEVKTQVEQSALLEKAGGIQVADKKIAQFRQQSDIKITLPGYESLLAAPKKP